MTRRAFLLVALAALAILPAAHAALPAGPGAVSVVNFMFVDKTTGEPVTVVPAGPVVFSFDSGCHTVSAIDGSFSSTTQCVGTFAHDFTAAGVYPYHCLIHANMNGIVVVTG